MLQHIDWRADSLIINIPQQKSDQTGEGLSRDKHVYANPLKPSICAVLSTAVLVFCTHRADDPRQQLFLGTSGDARFYKALRSFLDIIPETTNLGANKRDIGTHSNRKGTATFALAFPVISAVQVYLRAGWSLGNVPDRYIIAGAGSDQLVGRTVSGLPIANLDFATLPPHFTDSDLITLRDIGWSTLLPSYDKFPGCFKRALPYFLASLAFHLPWLRKNLGRSHPLWNQSLFTQTTMHDPETGADSLLIDWLHPRVITGRSACSLTNMIATGIPTHLALANEMNFVKEELAALKARYAESDQKMEAHVAHLERVVDNNKMELTSVVTEIPNRVKDTILSNFMVDGVAPVRPDDIARILETPLQQLRDEISKFLKIIAV